MKKIILSFIIILSINALYSEIFLTTLKNCALYNIYSDDLNPFINSTQTYRMGKNSILKLLEEIDYSNGFYNDILKVEIISGYHAGKTGYVFEEYTALNQSSLKTKYTLFFKNDFLYNNKLIKQNTKCEVIKSKIENENEVLIIAIDDPRFLNMEIEFSKKNELHFILNKKTELSYHIQRGLIAVKVINSKTLLPIQSAACGAYLSDEEGFIYIQKENTPNIIKKENYSEGIIFPPKKDEKIILSFIEELKISENQKESILEKNELFEIISDSKKTGISILDKNSLQIFSYPSFNNEGFKILGGFYFKDFYSIDKNKIKIYKTDKNVKLAFFDAKNLKWELISLEINSGFPEAVLSTNGYYLIVRNNIANNYDEIKINKKNSLTTSFLIKDFYGDIFYRYDLEENGINTILLPSGDYELFLLSSEYPEELISFKINTTDNKNKIIDVNKIISEKLFKEKKGFHKLYNGLWKKRAIKVNNIFTKSNDKILEHLGDILIENQNKIRILNDNFQMQGYIDIIDNNRINFIINFVDKKCFEKFNGQVYLINPSLFNSAAIIPAYYSFKAGILEINFNNIYFTRKNAFKSGKTETFLEIENHTFGYPEFPESEKTARYKLIFTQ